jgi:hypothetical protein
VLTVRLVPATEICTPETGCASVPTTVPLMVPVVCAQAMAGSSATNAPTLRNVDNLLMMDSWFDVILMELRKRI